MVEAPPYKPCAPSFFILLWWSESAGTSFCGFPDLKKRRKCKKRLPGLPRAVFFVSAIPPWKARPACRERLLQPSRTQNAKVVCNPFREGTPPRAGARLLQPSRTQNPTEVCKRACSRQAELGTEKRFASAQGRHAPACRRTLATTKPNSEPDRGLQARLLPPSRTWNAKKVCKRASLRLFFRRRFL
ncbi:hypothetical protein TRSA_19960 [Treponema saccharophilum]|nr:hypothetical protein TRSA_19960 [Treponema saccharophilum]